MEWIKRHPVLTTAAAFLIGTFPLWLGQVWPLLTHDTIPEWMAKRRWPSMTPELYWWVGGTLQLCIFGAFVMLVYQLYRLRKEEKQREALRHTITELQGRLAVFEGTEPHFVVECFSEVRALPQPMTDENGYTTSALALLRVTNEPKSLNKDAHAQNVYAWISYYDSQWNKLFPEVPGVWISLGYDGTIRSIHKLYETIPVLKPQEWQYLGVAIGDVILGKEHMSYAAFTISSHEWEGWLQPSYLFKATLNNTVNIRVTIGCHGLKETYYFVLKNCGPNEGLRLERTHPPATKINSNNEDPHH